MPEFVIPADKLLELAALIVEDGNDQVSISLVEAEDEIPASVHFEAFSTSYQDGWIAYDDIFCIED